MTFTRNLRPKLSYFTKLFEWTILWYKHTTRNMMIIHYLPKTKDFGKHQHASDTIQKSYTWQSLQNKKQDKGSNIWNHLETRSQTKSKKNTAEIWRGNHRLSRNPMEGNSRDIEQNRTSMLMGIFNILHIKILKTRAKKFYLFKFCCGIFEN